MAVIFYQPTFFVDGGRQGGKSNLQGKLGTLMQSTDVKSPTP
jgi:hypothetical protein